MGGMSSEFFLNNIFLNRNSENSARFPEIRKIARRRHGPCRNNWFRHGRHRNRPAACRPAQRQAWPTSFGVASAETKPFGTARAESRQTKRGGMSSFEAHLLLSLTRPVLLLSFFRFQDNSSDSYPQKILNQEIE